MLFRSRGLLLLRVRDEIRMTICAYQSLYESSIAFGMRKALQAEQRRNKHNKTMKELMVANRKLKEEVEELEVNPGEFQASKSAQKGLFLTDGEHQRARGRSIYFVRPNVSKPIDMAKIDSEVCAWSLPFCRSSHA